MSETKEKVKSKILTKLLTKKVITVLVVFVAIVVVILGVSDWKSTQGKSTKLKFENIGELATQCAYSTEIKVIEEARTLFKVKIPFTQSKYIYSMDFEIKAGYDFEKIFWEEKSNNKIVVTMPPLKVISNEPRTDTVKIYHEEESAFKQISLTDVMVSIDEMKNNAQRTAIENGLFDNAKQNAETLIKGFLGQKYDTKEYKIEFKYEDNKQ